MNMNVCGTNYLLNVLFAATTCGSVDELSIEIDASLQAKERCLKHINCIKGEGIYVQN